jgi:MarR family 2-MHQ and catechol resistance regulon transcriptional repressor
MVLEKELGLKKGFKVLEHETVLNIYYTASQIKKKASDFFQKFGLTDVQFNVLMLLVYQSQPDGGLSQAQLSDMMLVNRANITSLIDRMEKAQLVVRTSADADRRSNIVRLTDKGKKLFNKVEPLYQKQVRQLMSILSPEEQAKIISILEKIREGLVFLTRR